MKCTTLFAALIISVCFLSSCSNLTETTTAAEKKDTAHAPPAAKSLPGTGQLAKLSWLVGSWKLATPDGTAYEVWKKDNETTFSGKSFFVKGKDTIPQETISLQETAEGLCYIPTVHDQNGGKPVSFALTVADNGTFVFENPAHDFPQKITYRKITDDSLYAAISGKTGGKEHVEDFPMGRVK